MKRLQVFSIVAIAAVLISFKLVDATWTLDKSHAKLGFSITHLLISDVEGSFKKFDSKITTTKDDFSDAVAELTAEVASIDTDDEKRDEHLKNEDFFDAQKFPSISFKSTSFKKISDKKYLVKGNLTMHGVTKPVVLNATANTGVNPMSKKTIAGFKITGSFKRSDFNIGTKYPNAMLSDEVLLNANAEYVKN